MESTSREILFRGKVSAYNYDSEFECGEWVRGLITFVGKYNGIDAVKILTEDGDECWVDPETVGQYTGLTDKNGIKIFEGDIIKAIWRHLGNTDIVIGLVKFIDASFVLESKNEYLFFEDNIFGIECEIIGNIHDNPELLKGAEQ